MKNLKTSILTILIGVSLWACNKDCEVLPPSQLSNEIELMKFEIPEKYKSESTEIGHIRKTSQKVLINNKQTTIFLIEAFSKDDKIISIETSLAYCKKLNISKDIITNNQNQFDLYIGNGTIFENTCEWRLFGKEETKQHIVPIPNDSACEKGIIRHYYQHYFFGFKTRTSTENLCIQ